MRPGQKDKQASKNRTAASTTKEQNAADLAHHMGKAKEAVDEYKIIYMADSGYRDVAKKINDFYERQKGATA